MVEDERALGPGESPFLRLRRRRIAVRHPGQPASAPIAYDAVERRAMDAVAVLPHFASAEGRRVVLRSSVRPPIPLRPTPLIEGPIAFPVGASAGCLWEVVAGLVEPDERTNEGLFACAMRETEEEVGLAVPRAAMWPLGGAIFPTAGVIGEAIYFFHCEVDFETRVPPAGDGSPLEEHAAIITPTLDEALGWLDGGALADAKTEIALRRLARLFDKARK